MKYTYTQVESGPCSMDLLDENDDPGRISLYTHKHRGVGTGCSEQSSQHYVLFSVKTGLIQGTPVTAVMYNSLEQYQWPMLKAELGEIIAWFQSCRKTAEGMKTTSSW